MSQQPELKPRNSVPFWTELPTQEGTLILMVRGEHGETGEPMDLIVAEVVPSTPVTQGKNIGKMLYSVTLYMEVIPGTPKFERMVENSPLGHAILGSDARHYVIRQHHRLTLDMAKFYALAHCMDTSEEDLDAMDDKTYEEQIADKREEEVFTTHERRARIKQIQDAHAEMKRQFGGRGFGGRGFGGFPGEDA